MIGSDAIRTVAPAALPVTLAEVKAQVRYFESDEDALLVGLIRAAMEYVENYTGLALITQTWSQTFPSFPQSYAGMAITTNTIQTPLKLSRRPLQTVLSVTYLDSGGVSQPLDTTVYRVSGAAQPYHPAMLSLNTGQSWPTTYVATEAVTVSYRAGFGDTHNDVPELIRQAIAMTVATWFAFREEVVMGATVAELPFSGKVLLRDYRPLAVA
jgi:uncharacterized phiE125 gp8 family phage protein